MSSFEAGEEQWVQNLGGLRNMIRQEMIARQLSDHVDSSMSVLDVGCGQGTQALRLAELGCVVTGVDPSEELLARCERGAQSAGVEVELEQGRIEDLSVLMTGRRFDLVCAHGLLMYLDDRAAALKSLSGHLGSGGRLSVTVRNGHALALRPGLRGDWAGAVQALDSNRYVNELGVEARADRIEDVVGDLADLSLRVAVWYGVRVFNDAALVGADVPSGEDLALLLKAEDLAGRRDPYRWMGSQLHVVAAASPVDRQLH